MQIPTKKKAGVAILLSGKTNFKKDIKENLNKWRYMFCSSFGGVKFIKLPISPSLICTFNAIPIKILAGVFVDRRIESKIYIEKRGKQNSQNDSEKEEKVRGFALPDF